MMRIAFSTNGRDLDSRIDPAFGRCKFFIVVEPVTFSYDVVENPGAEMGSGAGIKAAELLANMSVDKVVTGSVGPNARPILASARITIISNASGKIRDVLGEMAGPTEINSNEPDSIPVSLRKRKPEGFCYCPKCKYTTENDLGGPCFNLKCPQCGIIMERKYS